MSVNGQSRSKILYIITSNVSSSSSSTLSHILHLSVRSQDSIDSPQILGSLGKMEDRTSANELCLQKDQRE